MRPQGHRASAGRRDGGPPSSSSVLTSPAPLWDLSLPPARDPPFPLSVAAGPCSRVRPRGDTAKQWMGEGRGVRGCSLPVRAKLGHLRGRSAGAGVVRAGAAGNSTRLGHAPPPRCRGLHPGSPPPGEAGSAPRRKAGRAGLTTLHPAPKARLSGPAPGRTSPAPSQGFCSAGCGLICPALPAVVSPGEPCWALRGEGGSEPRCGGCPPPRG